MGLNERQDLWIRARKNALASESARVLFRRLNIAISLAESALIVAAIAVTSLGFYLLTWRSSPGGSTPSSVFWLGLSAVVLNALALLIHLVADKLGWGARSTSHGHLAEGYSMIAQRLRNMDDAAITMAKELFMVYKSQGVEPSDWHFAKADKTLPMMRPFPLGLTDEQILESVRPRKAER